MLEECFEKLETNVKYFTFDGQTDGTHSINSLFKEVEDSSVFKWENSHFKGLYELLHMFLWFYSVEEINGTNDVAIIGRSSGTTGMPKGRIVWT